MSFALSLIQIALAAILVAAAIGKLRSGAAWRAFVASLAPLVPGAASRRVFASGLVASEVATTVALVAAPRAGALAAVAVFGALTAGVVIVVARKLVVRCHCFGRSGEPLGSYQIVRNAVLALAAGGLAYGLHVAPLVGSLDTLALAAVGGVLTAVAVIRSEDLWVVFARPVSLSTFSKR